MTNILSTNVISTNIDTYYYSGDRYMTDKNKKTKPKLTFTYYNPNTPEKTKEMIKNIILKILIDEKRK